MDWNEYQAWVKTKARKGGAKLNMLNAALGLAGEAGEVADVIKKHVFHKHPLDNGMKLNLLAELGDALFYLTWAAELSGFTLESVANYNTIKLNRRYPEGFDTERSINREEGK